MELFHFQPYVLTAQKKHVKKRQQHLETPQVAAAFEFNSVLIHLEINGVASAPVNFQVQMMLARGNIEFDLLIILYFSNDITIEDNFVCSKSVYVSCIPFDSYHYFLRLTACASPELPRLIICQN